VRGGGLEDGGLPARLPQEGVAKRNDEPRLLRDWDELGRRTGPRTASTQRASASTPTTSPLVRSTIGR
jgi:hypothetical protein